MMLHGYGVTHGADGIETTPASLNEYFNQGQVCEEWGCYSKGYAFGNLIWDQVSAFTKEAHEKHGTQKIQRRLLTAFDDNVVRESIRDGNPVILKGETINHWFLGKGTYPSTIAIHDPFYDHRTLDNNLYTNSAGVMAAYETVNSDFSSLEITTKKPTNILLIDGEGRKTGYDASTGEVFEDIPNSSYVSSNNIQRPGDTIESGSGVHSIYIRNPEKGDYTISAELRQD